jgi:hypothetical protein
MLSPIFTGSIKDGKAELAIIDCTRSPFSKISILPLSRFVATHIKGIGSLEKSSILETFLKSSLSRYTFLCPELIEEGRDIFPFFKGMDKRYLSTDLLKKEVSCLDFGSMIRE